jgi:hypothetical protein
MNLLAIESSRIIFLMQTLRQLGQIYIPDAIARVKERYSFVKAPNPDQTTLPLSFSIGKFRNAQIAEFAIYNDGFIVSSASDTDLLDAFIEDLLKWAAKELDIKPLTGTTPEKFYESSIIVKADADLTSSATIGTDISRVVAPAMKAAKISAPLKLSGVVFDFDTKDFLGKRKPFRLTVDRRIGIAFSENIFYSQAPFRTKDHLEILALFERNAPKK